MIAGTRGLVGVLVGFLLAIFVSFSTPVVFADDETQPAVQTQSSQRPAASSPAGNDSSPQTGETQAESDQKEKQNKNSKSDRVFFVIPNFLTVSNESKVQPLRWKQKFAITAKGVFDPYEFAVVGILAGIRQAENAYPGFGQGVSGYAKRYGTAITDQIDGNFMVGAIYPSILKTDPRYFQLGEGKFFHRTVYAISRLFITRKDSGGETFNLAESLGNGTAIGISNLYYPASDRGVTSSISDWGVQMGIDAVGNELKEFWPDLRRRFARHKPAASSTQ